MPIGDRAPPRPRSGGGSDTADLDKSKFDEFMASWTEATARATGVLEERSRVGSARVYLAPLERASPRVRVISNANCVALLLVGSACLRAAPRVVRDRVASVVCGAFDVAHDLCATTHRAPL